MSGCPHQAGQQQAAPASEGPLNPSNAMPADLHKQLPSPGQRVPLSTERQTSSIPKQEQGYWEYPSPQMFYNAMKRKARETFLFFAGLSEQPSKRDGGRRRRT